MIHVLLCDWTSIQIEDRQWTRFQLIAYCFLVSLSSFRMLVKKVIQLYSLKSQMNVGKWEKMVKSKR